MGYDMQYVVFSVTKQLSNEEDSESLNNKLTVLRKYMERMRSLQKRFWKNVVQEDVNVACILHLCIYSLTLLMPQLDALPGIMNAIEDMESRTEREFEVLTSDKVVMNNRSVLRLYSEVGLMQLFWVDS